MKSGAVNLTVHRNTRGRQEARRVRDDLKRNARSLGQLEGVAGWAMVAWDTGWNYKVFWDTNNTMPGNVVPEFVKQSLLREVGRSDAQAILDPVPPDDGA